MSRLQHFLVFGVMSMVIWLVTPPPAQPQGSFTEDFSTTALMDPANTSAVWDTVAGEITLAPFSINLTGSYGSSTAPHQVAVSGDIALVAYYSDGVHLLDISDLTNPTVLDVYSTPGVTRGVAVDGTYVYVADGASGVHILTLTYPGTLTYLSTVNTPGTAFRVIPRGEYLYVADHSGGLQVIDISDPSSPLTVGSCPPAGYMGDLKIAGNYAFVSDITQGMSVVDIANPLAPVIVTTYPGDGNGIDIDGNLAYLADDAGLVILDITNPVAPAFLGSVDAGGTASDVFIDGDIAYVADYGTGVVMVDVSDPENPTITDIFGGTGQRHVTVHGDHAFACENVLSLQIFEIADPAGLVPYGSASTPGSAVSVLIEGDHAFVAAGTSWLVFDVSDPAAPSLVGQYDASGLIRRAVIDGDYAFLIINQTGWLVLDISNPTTPSLLYSDPLYNPLCIAARGDQVFVLNTLDFLIYDISDPSNPILAGSTSAVNAPKTIALAGRYAFVGDDYDGLVIYDIGDPTSISIAGTAAAQHIHDIALAGKIAYLTNYTDQIIHVFDISNPVVPVEVNALSVDFMPFEILVSGNCTYVAGYSDGVYEFDTTIPADPVVVRHRDTYQAYGLDLAGDLLYVADGSGGLEILTSWQREVDTEANVAQSLIFAEPTGNIVQVKISPLETGETVWALGTPSGSWTEVDATGGWKNLNFPGGVGPDLRWRATLYPSAGGVLPSCNQVTISWLFDDPTIELIEDIPNDQGRQVRIHWLRSGNDYWGSDVPITEYAIYRLIDDPARKGGGDDPGRESSWDYITSVPAAIDDYYSAVVPTLADSTESGGLFLSTFRVRAFSAIPGYDYDSASLSGYSVDNLSPSVPTTFWVVYGATGGNDLTWDESPEEDFRYFRVYRGDSEDFIPSPENVVHECTAPVWMDTYGEVSHHYKVTALDFSGNESDPATAESDSDAGDLPLWYAFRPSYPNPFSSQTSLGFDLPRSGSVSLEIFDVGGRLVRTLVNGDLDAGSHAVTWAGYDHSGHRVGSGVYFARLAVPGHIRIQKMLMK
ncbi:FlgD immunoglobulin-like domain containing protein [Candidatus Eisenbacteria bacterium]|uniref:FlgD immunoglobulin-like domain containing protein n=1 Tax=Eiseniibacteriota bacterium TaxID=2212470 RepID=A0ABV6YJP7_UNCEI